MSAHAVAAAAGCCCQVDDTPCTPVDAATESAKPIYNTLSVSLQASSVFSYAGCCGETGNASVSMSQFTLQRIAGNLWRSQPVQVGTHVGSAANCVSLNACCSPCPNIPNSECLRPWDFGSTSPLYCTADAFEDEIPICTDCTCYTYYPDAGICDEPSFSAASTLIRTNVPGTSVPLLAVAQLQLQGICWYLTVFVTQDGSGCPGSIATNYAAFVSNDNHVLYLSSLLATKCCRFPGDGPMGAYATGGQQYSQFSTYPCPDNLPSSTQWALSSFTIAPTATVS